MTEAQSATTYASIPAPSVAGDPRRKLPLLALVLSGMPGLGQVYVGYYQRGFVHAIVVGSLLSLLDNGMGPLDVLGSLFLAFFWLYNMVDAGRRALLYNEALAGRAGIDLPEDLKSPAIRGSIPGGLAIIAVGGVLLSNTLFGVPLDWISNWWPAALVIFGVYLVGRSILGGRATSAP